MKTELIFFIIILLFTFSSQLLNPISKKAIAPNRNSPPCPEGHELLITCHPDGSMTYKCVKKK